MGNVQVIKSVKLALLLALSLTGCAATPMSPQQTKQYAEFHASVDACMRNGQVRGDEVARFRQDAKYLIGYTSIDQDSYQRYYYQKLRHLKPNSSFCNMVKSEMYSVIYKANDKRKSWSDLQNSIDKANQNIQNSRPRYATCNTTGTFTSCTSF